MTEINTKSRLQAGHLCLILIVATLVGCQDTRPLQLRYNTEKALFEANQELEKIQIKPEFVTDEQITDLRNQYQSVMQQALEYADSIDAVSDSAEWRYLQLIAYESAHRAEKLATAKRNFGVAIEIMETLLSRATLPPQNILISRLQLGRSLQKSAQWDSAKVIYDDLVSAFYPPIDSKGEIIRPILDLPYNAYLVETDITEGKERDSIVALTENYYLGLLSGYPSGNLAVSVRALLSVLYQREERFEESLQQLELVIDSTGQKALQARIRSWDINTFSLNDPRQSLADIAAVDLVGADTVYIPLLFFKSAEAYLELSQYDSCRSAIYEIKNNYPRYFARNAVAQDLIAKSFSHEGKWERAENEYRWMIETFPNSQVSFRAFIEILNHYKTAANQRRYDEWQQRAFKFYRRAANRGSGGPLEATAYSFMAEINRLAEDWTEAAKNLEHIAKNFSTSEIGRRSALRGALLYRDKLADTTSAEELFKVFKSSWPESHQ